MFAINQQLINSIDYDNAMYFYISVSVYQGSELISNGGIIQSHTDHSVKINDAYYLKSTCQFRVNRITINKR